jgi:starvation-inducible outer membrane lipoprotein
MMSRTAWLTTLALASMVGLSACGEKPQALGAKNDATAFSGVTNAFAAPGWQAGDKNSWEQHLRARAQYGMNDNTRAP